jgi:hypothetical protein
VSRSACAIWAAVVRVAGQRADAEHELPARGAGVAHRDADLDAELVAHPRLALADALHLRGVQRVELARVARALDQQPGHALLGGGEGGLEVRPARDLPRDIAVQPAEEGAQPPDMAQRLPVAGAVHQPRRLAPGLGGQPHEGLAQRHAVPAGEAGQPADAGVQQVAVGRVRHRFDTAPWCRWSPASRASPPSRRS